MDLSKIDRCTYSSSGKYNIRFGSKLYRQNVGISMGTNYAPLVLICFCSTMRGTSWSLSQKKNMIDAFNSTSRYLDDLLNIDIFFTLNIWFTEYIPLNFNLIKLMLLVPKQPFKN